MERNRTVRPFISSRLRKRAVRRRSERGRNALPAHATFDRNHRVFSNVKRWALGTFHGFREKHMDASLDAFVFRWNRRRSLLSVSISAGFRRRSA
ncbi:transposase [Jiella pacifica]|uniref:transposase n=1 Tax=Jiella pacifica TaxID=2696469 RepID=UPI0024844F02|nr:transposase [Jiella pacifica]